MLPYDGALCSCGLLESGQIIVVSDFKRPHTLVIFAGGKGKRLGNAGVLCPKPAIKIAGKPLVCYLVDWAQEQGFNRIIMAGGHLFSVLCENVATHFNATPDSFDDNTISLTLPHGCELILRDTGAETQTAERLRAVSDLVSADEYFVLTYGDTLTDLAIDDVFDVAKRAKTLICLVAGYPDARYGELVIEGDLVVRFREKERPKFRVNRGFFVVHKDIFKDWQDERFISFELDVLPYYTKKSEVAAHASDSWFFSVDTEADASELSQQIKGRAGADT